MSAESENLNLNPYLECLPYCDEIKRQKEPIVWLKTIRENLVHAIAQADFAPLAIKWTKKLHTYLDMKYELSLDDRVFFIQLYYELIILPSMPPILLDIWCSILCRLLKHVLLSHPQFSKSTILPFHNATLKFMCGRKTRRRIPLRVLRQYFVQIHKTRKKLKPVENTLVFDWRPFFNIVERTTYRKQTAPQVPMGHSKAVAIFGRVLEIMNFYFSAQSADEITTLLLPRFSLHHLQPTLLACSLWNLFVPTRHATRKHVTILFEFWSHFMNCNSLDTMILDWLSRVALDQHNFPWEFSEIQKVFNKSLQLLDLPVGSSAITTSISSSASTSSSSAPSYSTAPLSLASSLRSQGGRLEVVATLNPLFAKKSVYDPLRAFSRIAIATITLPKSLKLLSITLQSITNFYHPSNSGKWATSLTSFLRYLATAFTRLKHKLEEEAPEDTEKSAHLEKLIETQPAFIDLLKPLVFYALFSKSKTSMHSALIALKRLAYLNPLLIMPPLLELVYPALVSSTESHRTFACISALGATFFTFHTLEVALNPETGISHLNMLMFLVLPGLDVNDSQKTHATLQFMHSVLVSHPFMQDPEAMDWLVQFLKQVFHFIEQFDESTDHQGSAHQGDDLNPLFYTLLDDLFSQLPLDSLYPVALNKVLEWCRTHFLPMSATPVSQLVYTLVKCQPHLALPKFLDWLIPKIQFEMEHEAGTVSTLRTTKQSSLNPLLWFLRITMGLAECPPSALNATKAQWERILSMVFQFKDRNAMQKGHSIFEKLVQSLTMFHLLVPSEVALVDTSFEFKNIFIIPTSAEHEWAKALVHQQLESVTSQLQQLCDTQVENMSEFEVQHAFLTHISLLQHIIKATTHWRRHAAKETLYVDRCVDGEVEFEKLAHVLYTVYSSLFHCTHTPVDLLELIVETVVALICHYSVDVDKVSGQLDGYAFMKDLLRPTPHSKVFPLAAHHYRIWLCHLQRLQANAIRLTLNPKFIYIPKLMELLLFSCQSEFLSLRKESLNALLRTLKVYPAQKFPLLTKLLENLVSSTAPASNPKVATNLKIEGDSTSHPCEESVPKKVSSDMIEGILNTLGCKPFMLACARNPIFLRPFIQGLIQVTKVQTDWKGKPPSLLHHILVRFMLMYPTLPKVQPPSLSLQKLLTPYLSELLSNQTPDAWIQSAKSSLAQNQNHMQNCIAYITELLSNGSSLHWRTTTLGLQFAHVFLRLLPTTLANVVIPYCTDVHPTIRTIAESCTREWLALVKAKTVVSKKAMLGSKAEGYIDDYDGGSFQTPAVLFGYPFNPQSTSDASAGDVDMELLKDSEAASTDALLVPIVNTFFTTKFLERIFHYHSIETANAQTNSELFCLSTALLAKQLAGLLGPSLLPLMLPLLTSFLHSDEPAKIRCGVEWGMGLLRGTKHWSDPQVAWKALSPSLQQIHKAGPELLSIWEFGLRFLCRRRDPRRYEAFIKSLWKVPSTTAHVFSESRDLKYLKGLVSDFGPKLDLDMLTESLKQLQKLLSSPLKLIRTPLAHLIFEIFQVLFLTTQGKEILNQYIQKWSQENDLMTQKTLVILFHHASRHYKKYLFQAMLPSWFRLVELLVMDKDPDNTELGSACFVIVAQTELPFSLKMLPTDAITLKLKRLQFLQIYLFHHLFYVFELPPIEGVVSLLCDPSLEVRNLAGITLTGFFQCFPEMQQKVLPIMQAWLKSKDPIERHAGVLILISRIAMYPYSMPVHVPELLEQLARYVDDHLYIQAAVRKAFSEFRRTHMDTWHLDLQQMTGEQVSLMSDVLASSSYFV